MYKQDSIVNAPLLVAGTAGAQYCVLDWEFGALRRDAVSDNLQGTGTRFTLYELITTFPLICHTSTR